MKSITNEKKRMKNTKMILKDFFNKDDIQKQLHKI